MSNRILILLLLFSGCPCLPTQGQPNIRQMSYWEGQSPEAEQLSTALENVFIAVKPGFLNLSKVNSTHWLRLHLSDVSDTNTCFLVTNSYHLADILLFVQQSDGVWHAIHPTQEFTDVPRMVLLNLSQYQTSAPAYLRIKVTRPTRLQLRTLTEPAFRRAMQRERIGFYTLFGVLLVLVLVLLGVGVKRKLPGSLWMGAALLLGGVYVAALNGLWLNYALHLSAPENEVLQNVAAALLFFCMIRFTRNWQQTHHSLPDLDIFARFLEGSNLLLAIASFFISASFFSQVCLLNALFSSNLVFFLLLLRRAHGNEYLGIAVSGAYLGTMGFLMMILRMYGVIAISFLNLHSIAFGLALQFLCLAISFFRTPSS